MTEQDVVELLTAQHEEIFALLARLKAGEDGKQDLFTELVRLPAVHESAEEEVVHPVAARARFGADADIVQPRLEEENAAERAPRGPLRPGGGRSRFRRPARAVRRRRGRARRARGDRGVHPAARAVLDQPVAADGGLGTRRRSRCPHSPAPHAGESAVANLLAGPPLAVFDRARDAVRDWRQNQDT